MMFFNSGFPFKTILYSGWLEMASLTAPDIHIPPGLARGGILEATLTPSPKISPSSTVTSPICIPILTSSLKLSGRVSLYL